MESSIKEEELSIGMINCSVTANNNFKMLKLSRMFDYSLTTGGDLVSLAGTFQSHFEIGDFCLDYAISTTENATWQRIALTSHRCPDQQLTCVRSCCSNFNLAQDVDDVNKNFSCVFNNELGPTLDPATWNPNTNDPTPEVALGPILYKFLP